MLHILEVPMKKKPVFYTELAYVLGIVILALGTALMERADFGMSMVVAPAYLLHLKLSQYLPFFSFGMSEYVFQAFLLILISLVMGKFKGSYIFSFLTAMIYGIALDFLMGLVALLPGGFPWQVAYILGMVISSTGVALLFHTYIPVEAYELFVKEISQKYSAPIGKVKTIYDCCSCILGIGLSFLFFGFGVFVGVKWGTVVCAVVNGWLIGNISKFLENRFAFQDALSLRKKLR